MAISVLGTGLHDAEHYEDALSVIEAELAMERRLTVEIDHELQAARAALRARETP